ncbi:MAG: hypothetical protein COV48_07660 [Elusimicrobia bacterium CG11_big_fil_rev_8_21_14_0_20_64_6]|nr:MAG: hypothetical protein COV48_07660 [Elusimicrobia bacterium CG11_big_fil_rev_8_21_14_0_20_64_6]
MAEVMNCPKCRAPLEAVELAPGIVVRTCTACSGVLYATDDLAVPLNLIGPKPARFDCPRCRRPMETATAYDGKIEVDRCLACRVLWFDAGEIQILRKLSGVENLAGKPKADAPTPLPLGGPAVAAAVILPGVLDRNKKQKIPKASDPSLPPEMEGANNLDAYRAPTITVGGRVYRHFQTSVPVTTSVLGEFPWVAEIGDTVRMRDFICPPYLVSQEVSATESVWSGGEYVEPEEIWTAFALPGYPPAKISVAAAQPNPWAGAMSSLWLSFSFAAAVCIGVYAYFSAISSGKDVYEGQFSVAASDVERARVGDIFEVGGRTSNLAIILDSNLDGRWAYVNMTLIDADTDKAIDFGRELSYYHGYEDGESWSEGSRYATVYVPSVPAGRYYLRLEPESDSPQLSLRVGVKRDVPLARIPLIALLLLSLPMLWAQLRYNGFENERWMESDHPRVSSDDEDDE